MPWALFGHLHIEFDCERYHDPLGNRRKPIHDQAPAPEWRPVPATDSPACFGWPLALGAGRVQRLLRHSAREGWIARADPGVNLEPRYPGGDNSMQAPPIERWPVSIEFGYGIPGFPPHRLLAEHRFCPMHGCGTGLWTMDNTRIRHAQWPNTRTFSFGFPLPSSICPWTRWMRRLRKPSGRWDASSMPIAPMSLRTIWPPEPQAIPNEWRGPYTSPQIHELQSIPLESMPD